MVGHAEVARFDPGLRGRGRFRLALALAVLALAGCGQTPPPPVVRPALVIRPVPAGAQVQAYAGEVRARYEPALAFRIGGKLAARMVDVGDRVKAGQPLATLDPQDVRLQVQSADAQLAAVQADLVLARSERERYRALAARQVVSRSQLEAVENTHDAAAARVAQIRAERSVAGNQSAYATLRADAAGVITAREAEAGQVVAAGQIVFLLARDGDREVAIALPEQRIGDFAVGQPVAVELWSQPDVRHPGRIRQLAPSADARSRTFAARIAFDDAGVPAQLGQSARVYVQGTVGVGVSVPLAAVGADDGRPFVWTVDAASATVRRVPVTIGSYAETSVPVLQGLTADQWIVGAGVHLLREGQPIAPVDARNRPVALAASGRAGAAQ